MPRAWRSSATLLLSSSALLGGCRTASPAQPAVASPPAKPAAQATLDDAGDEADVPSCGGEPLTVTFYDAGQALAALVTLPDSRRILVDAGESPTRPGCGAPCGARHNRVVEGLTADLAGAPIDMVWITHQHSDHHGGLPGLAENVQIRNYVDNGEDPTKAGVRNARAAAEKAGASPFVVAPGQTDLPLQDTAEVQIRAVVPDSWPAKCASHQNDCSIGLLITYCDSSILFTGDAEERAERVWDVRDINLLQVGHHGSDTSTSQAFVDRVKPEYAVISCAPRGEGTNRTYCHPRRSTVDRLVAAVGGEEGEPVVAFDAGTKCTQGTDTNWAPVRTSDRLWNTARDGIVTLVTTGAGDFRRL